jgi:MFS family permease
MADLVDGTEPNVLASTRNALRETRQSLASVFVNPSLRRVQLALAGSMIGDWAYATAVAVWAYDVGGATAVGIWTAVRLALMALTAPVTAGLADRFPRKQVMIGTDLVRAVTIGVTAVLILTDAPPAPIFVLATLAALFGTPFRAAQRALMPSLVTRPEELTASNGASSTIESLAFFVGPAIGASLVALSSVATVFIFDALTFVWSMAFVIGIKVPPAPAAREEADNKTPTQEDAEKGPGFLTETMQGFRAIAADRDLTVVVAQVAAQTVVAGASVVMGVAIAVDVLGTGPEGVGYLDSALGVGAIVGGLFAISRASKHRLGQDMTLGVILWAIPLLLFTAAPLPAVAFLMMAILGFANPLVDVNMDTIVQRLTPDAVMGRVFGALEACLIATMALGALAMPLLLHLVGLRAAMAVIGLAVTAVALLGLPRMRRLDHRLGVPSGVPLLQAIPLFAPLSPGTVETLARALVRVEVAAGEVVVREGDESDLFYVIESGEVEVTQGGQFRRRESAGDFFGEIGLVRDVPRTATITAISDVVLQALPREEFLNAVTGQSEARSATDDIITRRLAV